jgi:DNA-binding HxlR family transcriptional regulator
MEQHTTETLLHVLKVLTNEYRLRILGTLAAQECSVRELAASLHLKEPTVVRHLAQLSEIDLVRVRQDGNTYRYSLNSQALQTINKTVFASAPVTVFTDAVAGDDWERSVLRNFVRGDQLKEIPHSLKKRLVVLKWLASKFEDGVQYPETEVNEVLKRHHPDHASLRRALIDYNFMQRARGVYWRLPEAAWTTID